MANLPREKKVEIVISVPEHLHREVLSFLKEIQQEGVEVGVGDFYSQFATRQAYAKVAQHKRVHLPLPQQYFVGTR